MGVNLSFFIELRWKLHRNKDPLVQNDFLFCRSKVISYQGVNEGGGFQRHKGKLSAQIPLKCLFGAFENVHLFGH